MLKQSQNRTKRAAFRELSMSRQPASTIGWLATMPIVVPSIRAKPIRMLRAKSGWISKKSRSSTTFAMSSFMSYGLFGLLGTRVSSDGSLRSEGSEVGRNGGCARFEVGKKSMNRRSSINASTSFSNARSATPERVVWVNAPPNSSCVTVSCVTVLTTSGPVTNRYEVSLTMKMKSVIAGE